MNVSLHAAERYVERVAPGLDIHQDEDAMLASARAVDAAARFGCPTVRLGCGARLILSGDTVVTVLAAHQGRNAHQRPGRVEQ